MKYSFVYAAIAPAMMLLANADSVPPGGVHQSGWGNAVVHNNCGDEAYYVFDTNPTTATIAPSGTMQVPLYTKTADGGGASIKLFTNKNTNLYGDDPVTQFEITPTDMQYFDISNVNSNIGNGMNGNGQPCEGFPPFMKGGMALSGNGISSMSCAAGQNPCKTAYSKNDDNFATSAVPLGQDITLTLCPGGGSTGGGATGGQGQQSPPPQNPSPPQPAASQPQSSAPPAASPVVQEKFAANPPPTSSTPPPPPPPPPTHSAEPEQVVWVTHVVTADPVVETVHVNAKDKRAEHIHAHAHNKFHKRRIGL